MKNVLLNGLFAGLCTLLIELFLRAKQPWKFLAHGAAILFSALLLTLFILYLRHFLPLRRKEKGFEYVYVKEDGTVRELSEDEQVYLKTEFSPGDGARPYIKTRYNGKTMMGSIKGYIERRRVPPRFPIVPYTEAS